MKEPITFGEWKYKPGSRHIVETKENCIVAIVEIDDDNDAPEHLLQCRNDGVVLAAAKDLRRLVDAAHILLTRINTMGEPFSEFAPEEVSEFVKQAAEILDKTMPLIIRKATEWPEGQATIIEKAKS